MTEPSLTDGQIERNTLLSAEAERRQHVGDAGQRPIPRSMTSGVCKMTVSSVRTYEDSFSSDAV